MPLLNQSAARKFLLKTTVQPAWEDGAWTITHESDLPLARQPDVAPWIEFLGLLNREQIRELYREANLFVFPSLCESFGHPLVEAMGHGLPIVAADAAVYREVCGTAALYFIPQDPRDLAEKVLVVHLSKTGQRVRYDQGLIKGG